MKMPKLSLVLTLAAAFSLAPLALAQTGEQPMRVKVTKRDDGSTVNSTLDPSSHTCVEETRSSADKLIQKATYQLDPQNRPLTGFVENANGQFLYNVAFKNDTVTGMVLEETDTTKEGQMIRRLVFHYANGQLTGADAFDANGNQINSGPAVKDSARKKTTR